MDDALSFLLDQANQRENDAVLALSQARVELEGYYQQLEQIETYRVDYCNQLIERGKKGLSASEYSHLNRFLTTLDETLSKQKQAEAHFKSQVESCEQNWFECRKQRRSYEWLIEKKQAEKVRRQNVLEQKQMDDFSTLRYSRRSTN
ncbi:flagellar export protein FliJ [Vibrio ostreicida]|uniref:Flagellar FliJ protein n=1 Tax=Vibrio ostreicida TaxID=526588 RepID=A0ABT8BU45_9VIBR|nr:flagellar export protein FliJ [Vibrio ostreicida]MDN3610665.1 flagellar export protein FliJ [Vibrio ostreicida]NPD07337.1 flagella biosynthesis chaperone FliJ [Vibrio ostreicida]